METHPINIIFQNGAPHIKLDDGTLVMVDEKYQVKVWKIICKGIQPENYKPFEYPNKPVDHTIYQVDIEGEVVANIQDPCPQCNDSAREQAKGQCLNITCYKGRKGYHRKIFRLRAETEKPRESMDTKLKCPSCDSEVITHIRIVHCSCMDCGLDFPDPDEEKVSPADVAEPITPIDLKELGFTCITTGYFRKGTILLSKSPDIPNFYLVEEPFEGSVRYKHEVKKLLADVAEAKEKPLGEMNDLEKTKFFEDHLSPLIRYGYNTAILDIIEWVGDCEDHYLPLMNHLNILMEAKKQVDWDKLKIEVESTPPPIEVSANQEGEKDRFTTTAHPYQLCPKCHGQGTVSKPPWVPGDVVSWTANQTSYQCDVCNGNKIIVQALFNQEGGKEGE